MKACNSERLAEGNRVFSSALAAVQSLAKIEMVKWELIMMHKLTAMQRNLLSMAKANHQPGYKFSQSERRLLQMCERFATQICQNQHVCTPRQQLCPAYLLPEALFT